MVRQVSECTSTTISTERARNASLSIALDQAEERVEKLEREYKEVKEKLLLTESLHLLAAEQLVYIFFFFLLFIAFFLLSSS